MTHKSILCLYNVQWFSTLGTFFLIPCLNSTQIDSTELDLDYITKLPCIHHLNSNKIPFIGVYLNSYTNVNSTRPNALKLNSNPTQLSQISQNQQIHLNLIQICGKCKAKLSLWICENRFLVNPKNRYIFGIGRLL